VRLFFGRVGTGSHGPTSEAGFSQRRLQILVLLISAEPHPPRPSLSQTAKPDLGEGGSRTTAMRHSGSLLLDLRSSPGEGRGMRFLTLATLRKPYIRGSGHWNAAERHSNDRNDRSLTLHTHTASSRVPENRNNLRPHPSSIFRRFRGGRGCAPGERRGILPGGRGCVPGRG
jgi:hypothetical protein